MTVFPLRFPSPSPPAMNLQNEIDTTPWQNTFKKQRLLLLKRELRNYDCRWLAHLRQGEQRTKEDASNDLEATTSKLAPRVADAASNVRHNSKGVLPGLHPASPQVAAAVPATKPTVAQIPGLHSVSDKSDAEEGSAPPILPATDSLKARRLSSEATASMVGLIVQPFKLYLPQNVPGQVQRNLDLQGNDITCRFVALEKTCTLDSFALYNSRKAPKILCRFCW